jgi:GT2 family glycosyltransferase
MKIINIFLYIVKFPYNVILLWYRKYFYKKYSRGNYIIKKYVLKEKTFFFRMHKFLSIENFSIRSIILIVKLDLLYSYSAYINNAFKYYAVRTLNLSKKLEVRVKSGEIIVSIIIPTYKNRKKLFMCIESILRYNFKYNFEIIVVDDYDLDINKPYFIGKSIKCIKNKKNLGFIKSCNLGAENAIGKYLYFLNDDTIILNQNTIDSLVDRVESDNKIGLVGSKVLLNHKNLQEAGCLTFNTGDCWQYGKNEDKDQDLYNYSCEVDYCSGCSLLIPKKLFDKIKFNEIYLPAYYEDVDLAFSVRSMGYKVVYEPKSSLIHMEGSSTGTANTTGDVKKYQYINKEKFYTKWKISIKDKIKKKEILNSKIDRSIVLIVDDLVPDENRDAGSFLPLFFIEYYLKKN